MASYEERLASFGSRKSSKSSKKSTAPTTGNGVWPHGADYLATPKRLAQAGFYFLPTEDKQDNVACFMCKHTLGQWEPQDDPFSEHLVHSPKCSWAIARCSIELDRVGDGSTFVFTSASRLPTTKALERARAETFKGYWKHDKTKNHSANSKKMAKAGWIYNPSTVENCDSATCFYCGKSLDEWEDGNDPLAEHQTRVPDCAFFTAELLEQPSTTAQSSKAVATKPPRPKASHAKAGRKTSRTTTATFAVDSDVHETATESDAISNRGKRSKVKQSKATESEIDEAPTPVMSKPEKSRSKPKQPKSRIDVESGQEEVELEPTYEKPISSITTISTKSSKPKKGKAVKGKVVVPESEPEHVEEPIAPGKAPKGSSRSKSINLEDVFRPSATKAPKRTVIPKEELNDMMDLDVVENAGKQQSGSAVNKKALGSVPQVERIPSSYPVDDAEMELEALAKELHIEKEFAAIGKSTKEVPLKKSKVSKPPSTKPVSKTAWREKSIEPSEPMTEEEEVERSLLDDDEPPTEEEEPIPPSPPLAPVQVPPKSKKKKAPQSKQRLLEEDSLATPKARQKPAAAAPRNTPSPELNDETAFPFGAGILDVPILGPDWRSYNLTEEEREMALEDWVRLEMDRRKQEFRKEAEKWIQQFLEHAEVARERIKAL